MSVWIIKQIIWHLFAHFASIMMVLYRLTEHCGGGATEWIEHFNASFYSRIRILMRKLKAFKNI